MFNLKKHGQTNDQIPYAVFETAQYGNTRRYRWLYEVVVAAAIVAVLVLGAIWVYRAVHTTKTPTPTTTAKSRNMNVTQSPQAVSPATQPTGAPSTSRVAKSTNDASLPQPRN